jgi:hypothetical protein
MVIINDGFSFSKKPFVLALTILKVKSFDKFFGCKFKPSSSIFLFTITQFLWNSKNLWA